MNAGLRGQKVCDVFNAFPEMTPIQQDRDRFNENKECEVSRESSAGTWPAESQEGGSNGGGEASVLRDHTQVSISLISQ